MKGQLAVIRFIDREGHPIGPDNSLPEGSEPIDPDYGFNLGGHPSQGLPKPPRVWPPTWPPGPTDPDWGVGAPDTPSHPIALPIGPDQTLPPAAGHLPAPNPPPGTIWPPLPPGGPTGKVAVLVWISGVGHRYAVLELPPPTTPAPKA